MAQENNAELNQLIAHYQWKVQTDTDSEIRRQAFQTLQAQQSAAISNATVGGGKAIKT